MDSLFQSIIDKELKNKLEHEKHFEDKTIDENDESEVENIEAENTEIEETKDEKPKEEKTDEIETIDVEKIDDTKEIVEKNKDEPIDDKKNEYLNTNIETIGGVNEKIDKHNKRVIDLDRKYSYEKIKVQDIPESKIDENKEKINIHVKKHNVIVSFGVPDKSLYQMMNYTTLGVNDVNKLENILYDNFIKTLPNDFISEEEKEEQFTKYIYDYINKKYEDKKITIVSLVPQNTLHINVDKFVNLFNKTNTNFIYLNYSLESLFDSFKDSIADVKKALQVFTKYFTKTKATNYEKNNVVTVNKKTLEEQLENFKHQFESEDDMSDLIDEISKKATTYYEQTLNINFDQVIII